VFQASSGASRWQISDGLVTNSSARQKAVETGDGFPLVAAGTMEACEGIQPEEDRQSARQNGYRRYSRADGSAE
jgi:hypothetical protein